VRVSDSAKDVPGDVPSAAREALACYTGDPASARVSRLGRGLIHETFLVVEGERRRVLQAVNPIFSPDIHANIAAVTLRLAARGVETPLLERTMRGALHTDLGTKGRWRLMSHVQGESRDTCDSSAAARSAGALLGRFHSALDGLPHAFAPLGFPFHDTPRHFADLEHALEANRDHRLYDEVAPLAAALFRVASEWKPLGDLPQRVVHLDLKFNNVLFVEEEDGTAHASCIIDLDTLSRRPLWIELGDAWRSWCNRQREHEPVAVLDHGIFEASAEGWLSTLTIELSREELESLAHGIERLTIELGVRFAADALVERYFGWNRALFEGAGEHNLARARGQLSLHAQARETRAERLRFLLG